MPQTVTTEKFVTAPAAYVYRAFTNATVLREWLCDLATVAPRPGGRMYLWWHGEFYSNGEYMAVEENKSVTFKWFSRVDPVPTQVTVTLQEKDGGTLVTLAHTVPDGDDWAQRAEGFKQEWESSLYNLVSVLETGLDLRTFNRPMLGININDFNAEIAHQLGVPVTDGLRLDTVLEGMGAHAAGLRKDDVIISLGGKAITNDYGTLVAALQGEKGGDKVEVVFYRGSEKKTVSMELSRRPIPKVPFDAAELAKQVAAENEAAYAELAKSFEGVAEARASQRPLSTQWSAKEVLAHLIHSERYMQFLVEDMIASQEKWSDDWSGNVETHIRATVKAFPTVQALLEEYKLLLDETHAFIAAFPAEFVARKGTYFRAAAMLLNWKDHTLSHVDQIKAALKAAR